VNSCGPVPATPSSSAHERAHERSLVRLIRFCIELLADGFELPDLEDTEQDAAPAPRISAAYMSFSTGRSPWNKAARCPPMLASVLSVRSYRSSDHDLASPGPDRPSHSRRRGSKPNVFFAFWFEAPRSFVP
jgi:hypothetical protein